MNIAEIRQSFVGYYGGMGYQLLPSAPMIDPSIPMSFVMSAGLVQVENSIAKSEKREGNQFVLVQSCFRHFDLEKVGTDDIHLSLFEMPGAFLFGPADKTGTVQRMWTLATQILGIEKDRIWVSYFKGGEVMGESLSEDEITRQAWKNLGIPESNIVGLGTDNNYWIQGRGIDDIALTRKCGPNTELFYDRGRRMACSLGCKPSCKCGRFVEFSNSLFISSEIGEGNDQMRPLANPFTETVIGAERVSMIRQRSNTVFEISEFRPIMDAIKSIHASSLPYHLILLCERGVADHLRGLYYLIEGGAPPPGKNGRGRIIKILIRRVITRLIALDIDVCKSVPVLIAATSNSVPDIGRAEVVSQRLHEFFLFEYHRFMTTIKRGQSQLGYYLKENGGKTLSGKQIATLEKKWGHPALLTELTLTRQGLNFQEMDYRSEINSAR